MITITNGLLTASFSERGAELKSLTDGETEYLWPGDPAVWASSAPVLFPICSAMRNDTYRLGNREYRMPKHGFASKMLFAAEETQADAVTFLLTETEETLRCFPYRFVFRIRYTLTGKTLTVRYEVSNPDGKEMYFSVGAHEGYFCPEGLSAYEVVLPQRQTLVSRALSGPGTLGYRGTTVLEDGEVLPLRDGYFTEDALIFTDFKGDSLLLRNRDGSRALRVTFRDFPYLLLWSVPGGRYLCIEPWCGITDRDDSDGQIEHKQGICRVTGGETFVREHSIEILA